MSDKITDKEVEELKENYKKIQEKFPISKDFQSRIEAIAGFTIFVDAVKGPTNENHFDYYLLLNSLHFLVHDAQKETKKLLQSKG